MGGKTFIVSSTLSGVIGPFCIFLSAETDVINLYFLKISFLHRTWNTPFNLTLGRQ